MKKKKNFLKINTGKKKTFLAIIPARGNSKRIKNKNLKKLNNKPLIYWTIKAAKKSKFISNIYITSDSLNILNYCKKLNFKTILRPKKLSGNIIMPDEAIRHAYLKMKKKFDYIVMLQPTSPLRTYQDIDNSIKTIIQNKSDSLFSSSIQSKFISKSNLFVKNFNRLGGKISTYAMSDERSIDIDNAEDFRNAEKIIKKNY